MLERLDLGLQLDDGSRRRRPVENDLLGRGDFVVGGLIHNLDVVVTEHDGYPLDVLQQEYFRLFDDDEETEDED